MNNIKRLQNEQALSVSVENTPSEDQLMHILLINFHQGEKYTAQIAICQEELRREEKSPTKTLYILYLYRPILLILT